MPKHPDFDRLCSHAEDLGWKVGLSLSRSAKGLSLGSVKLHTKATERARIIIPVGGNLDLAARVALDQLIAQTGEL